MRLYTFSNMYLSSLQVGLQSAHVTHELFLNYPLPSSAAAKLAGCGVSEGDYLWDWAENHKTMILLNGGYLNIITDLRNFFNSSSNPYPWAEFHEGKDSLGGILTSVGIVLPEKIYLTAAAIRGERPRNGQLTIRESIEQFGCYTVGVENTLGFEVEQSITLSFTKWEYDLLNRLNQFGLAR